MGKAFKRGMNKSKNNPFSTLSREEAISKVVKGLHSTNKNDNIEDLITLFGL